MGVARLDGAPSGPFDTVKLVLLRNVIELGFPCPNRPFFCVSFAYSEPYYFLLRNSV